jgi:hypothetical protein
VVAVPVQGAVVVPQSAAQMQLARAQAGCAQADAYQNYVTQVVNGQDATADSMNQVLQTLADNTSDPEVQDALLNSENQPNPINDALDQQLQSQASAYEASCQTRLAAAQAAVANDPSQQQVATAAAPAAAYAAAPGDASQGGYQPADPTAAGHAAVAAPAPQAPAPQAQQPQTGACPPSSPANVPQAKAPWGPWTPLGNTGLVFGVSRVDATTLTWRFLNAGQNTIAGMNFNYSFIDANSGQPSTQSDLLPYGLAPGQSVGGWAAYTANTKGNITLSITQISCQ